MDLLKLLTGWGKKNGTAARALPKPNLPWLWLTPLPPLPSLRSPTSRRPHLRNASGCLPTMSAWW